MLMAIAELRFEQPMPVQEKVIPHLLNNNTDLVALAQTGTGKTAAFGLPILQLITAGNSTAQALVLSPTRELCLQIASDLADFSKYLDNIRVIPVYGGSSIESQIKAIRRGVDIIVATPGRLIDLINRGVVDLSAVHTVVLDEADEMLNMGFVDSINEILEKVPEGRQMLLFSATMPSEIARIARQYMHEPEEIVIGNRNEGAENVKHIYYLVNAKDKYLALKRVADDNPNIYAIVFCRTRLETQEIADALIADGYNADSLHGDLSQMQRDLVMKKFRDHVLSILVATDVAARGLDVDDLTHVINYGLPDENAVYTHRSGRTGRAGKTGISVAIIHSRERGKIRQIERQIGKQFEHKEVPTPQHIIERQLYSLADRLERIEVDEEEIAKYFSGVSKKLSWLSADDLLKRLLSLEFNRLLAYYKDVRPLDYVDPRKDRKNVDRDSKEHKARKPRNDAEKDRREAEKGYARVYVSAGKADGFFANSLINVINKNVKGERVDIGRIDLLPTYTLFDVAENDANRVVRDLRGADFFGTRLYSELAEPGKDYTSSSNRKKRRSADGEEQGGDSDRFSGKAFEPRGGGAESFGGKPFGKKRSDRAERRNSEYAAARKARKRADYDRDFAPERRKRRKG